MKEHAAVIVGAGPTGLMLAAELALAHVDVAIVEKRDSAHLAGKRAGGLHARTLEIFDQRGIAERFLAEGKKHPALGFSLIQLDLSDFPSRHNYVLGLWQTHVERILGEWVGELGVPIYRGREAVGVMQDDRGVDVVLSDGGLVHAEYVIGCDGGRSRIRKSAGIDFHGSDPTSSSIIAEVELAQEPARWGIHRDKLGIHSLSKTEDGRVRLLVTEREIGGNSDPGLAELREALVAVFGTDYGVHDPTWISRFTDATRQATAYRDRRVLLAGDAAHVHPPDGGQGLQIGVQDAVNLGWKLAQVIQGISPAELLDTYQAERMPVAARVLRNTLASVALRRDDDRTRALRATMTELLSVPQARERFAAEISGLDVHYDPGQFPLGEAHPLLGRRMPDLLLTTGSGPVRTFELLHDARPVLLNLDGRRLDIAPWSDRVRYIRAEYSGSWRLPVIGEVAEPGALLIRPDGYVAWVGSGTRPALCDTLATWFGAPRTLDARAMHAA
jgi:3-(3-hydroxy-phenyl)propionate hydroxylase